MDSKSDSQSRSFQLLDAIQMGTGSSKDGAYIYCPATGYAGEAGSYYGGFFYRNSADVERRHQEQQQREQERRRQEQEKEKKRLEEQERLEQEKRRQEEEKKRRLEEQAELHRQQQVRDHEAISTHELELAAAHDAVQQRVQQRTEQVDQFRMGIRQELNASLAETLDCRDLTEERDAVAQRHTERLALMAQQAAQLDADRQRQQEERVGTEADAAFQQAQQDVAQALSTHQLSLDALATAMAEHREAEHQRRVNDALTEELERLELEDMRVQVGMHA
ncbi:hypothetical protein BBJ28_00024905 [Nothophytophthora sp. Chile5]|nr:hypothetical protein BBJ28_00024905 [Nothophytophthora sp. Chile5]